MRTETRWLRIVACVVASMAGAARAGEKPPQASERVSMSVNLLMTSAVGATSKIFSWTLAPGVKDPSRGRARMPRFGVVSAAGSEGCTTTVGLLDNGPDQRGYALAWAADATVLESSTDRLVVSASWRRFKTEDDGEPTESAGESIPKLYLREDDRVLLDYVVPDAADQRRCARNYALELTAEVKEDPALAGNQIAYDAWLVHETSDRRKTSQRARFTARQGEKASFSFPKETLRPVRGSGGGPESLRVAVSGHTRGRVRKDGSVELAIDTFRTLSYVAPNAPDDAGGETGENGEKVVSVQPGEVIRIELPAAPEGTNGRERMARDLAGHSFALILTAKPVS